MRTLLFAGIIVLLSSGCFFKPKQEEAPKQYSNYECKVNLRELNSDRLWVDMRTPTVDAEEVIYCIPRIVPGIYGAMNFGRNLENFAATNAKGELLPVLKMDQNRWKISNARQLSHIRYFVNDGWENFSPGVTEGFYKSAESSFTENKVFVINNNTLFGYLEGKRNIPYKISFEKPQGFYGATTLPLSESSDFRDDFRASSYRELVDNPILYAKPDTAQFQVGTTKVLVACFSDVGISLSHDLAKDIKPIMERQRAYLGGSLPVDNYTYLVYHSKGGKNGFTGDGLEHWTSTLCLFNSAIEKGVLKNAMDGIASHEFFHTVTPLAVHSQEIENYDYINPKLSRHLWLYEGMTEYFTMHMPVKQGAESMDDFLATIGQKIRDMQQFDNKLPMTELSMNAIEKQDQYYNVYLKGALICMCLDIHLRDRSNGKYGVQDLMRNLMLRYGKDKSFQDDKLFDEISDMTYSDVRTFFGAFVEGSYDVPLQAYFSKVGLEYNVAKGTVSLTPNPAASQLQLRKAWIGQ